MLGAAQQAAGRVPTQATACPACTRVDKGPEASSWHRKVCTLDSSSWSPLACRPGPHPSWPCGWMQPGAGSSPCQPVPPACVTALLFQGPPAPPCCPVPSHPVCPPGLVRAPRRPMSAQTPTEGERMAAPRSLLPLAATGPSFQTFPFTIGPGSWPAVVIHGWPVGLPNPTSPRGFSLEWPGSLGPFKGQQVGADLMSPVGAEVGVGSCQFNSPHPWVMHSRHLLAYCSHTHCPQLACL